MSAGFTHVAVIGNLYDILKPHVKIHQLGRVFTDGLTYILHQTESGIHQARIPDLSFIRNDAIPSEFDHARPFPGAPTLAVEVISPSEKTADVMAKVTDYLRYGSEEVWAIYPAKKELHQYNLDDNAPKIYSADKILISASLFPQLSILINDLFVDI